MNRFQYISVVVLLLLASFADTREQCRTPKGALGQCIEIDQCPTLYALLKSPNRKTEDIKFLRDSQCKDTENIPKVCCDDELPCTTPSRESGVCKKFTSCSPLLSVIKSFPGSLPETVKKYFRDSACQGVEQYSVCCGQTVPDFSSLDAVLNADLCGTIEVQDKFNYRPVGTETYVNQYRWLALIEYRTSRQHIHLLCGAVLIGPKYLLTAAHCVKGPILEKGVPVSVRLGEHDINNVGPDCQEATNGEEDCSDGSVSIPIEEIIPHPDFNPLSNTRHDDIALVRLQTTAPFTDFIRHICLPTVDITKNLQSDSMNFSIAGWGKSDTRPSASNRKLKYEISFKSLEKCQAAYRDTARLWDKQMCAGDVTEKDFCGGDTGGPLMYCVAENRCEVIGILSFGPTPCEKPEAPAVYSKVIEYMDWIRSAVRP